MTDWNVGKLLEVSGSYWQACTLHAGVKLDLFSRIENGNETAENIAGNTGYDVRGVMVLLDALAAMGLIVKTGTRYSNTETAKFSYRCVPRHLNEEKVNSLKLGIDNN